MILKVQGKVSSACGVVREAITCIGSTLSSETMNCTFGVAQALEANIRVLFFCELNWMLGMDSAPQRP